MTRKILFFFTILLAFSCNSYKQTSVSSDVFLSHKIWKQNYQEYVYLVHDDESTLQLKDVTVVLDNEQKSAKTISGELVKYTPDTTKKRTRREINNDKVKTIDIYLTPNNSLEPEDGEQITLTEKDIHKVRLQTKTNTGVFGLFAKIVGLLVGIFLLLIILVFIALIASSGGGGSSSNSDPQCYVATMVYGSTESEEVLLLRQFRDTVLLPTRMGRMFVHWYYKNSPSFVAKHQHNAWLTKTIKAILNIFVSVLKRAK